MWIIYTFQGVVVVIIIIIIIIITDEYDLGGTVALLLQDHLTLLFAWVRVDFRFWRV